MEGDHLAKRFDISVLGELNCDLILYGLPPVLEPEREHLAKDFALTLGSSSAIFAHNISLLGSRVGFTSCIGGDPLGKFCVEHLSESGVDVSGVKRLPNKNTGVTVILPLGEKRHILTYPGTTFDLDHMHLDLDYLRDAAHFHLSSFFLLRALRPKLPELFFQMRQTGLTTSLDTNDDPDNLWTDDIKTVLKSVDVFLPNEYEACRVAGTGDVDSALDTLSHLVPIVVIKCGGRGALAKRGNERFHAASLLVQPVDTVGAGDSFNAGFLHKFIHGSDVQDCLEYGNVSAGLSTTRAGGTEAFRDREHRETFLQRYTKAH
ncbi:MAG: ribokinase [Acidobacteria bacterium 13_1_20CM_2_60_10]|nr:MAG: ribokinase [Acidobacteria bacterium 13_1_20CM_2_60_10]